jgi:hypothetical protein
MDRYEQPSSEDGLSIESPPAKVSQHINAIDLTRDDTPIVSSSNRIDLTGEAPAESGIMNVMEGRPADINSSMDPVSVATYTGNDPILLDSEDEDAQFSSDSDDPSEAADSVDSSSSDGYDVVDEIEDSEDGDAEENDSQEDVPVAPTMQAPGQLGGNSLARYPQMTNENPKVLLVDSSDHCERTWTWTRMMIKANSDSRRLVQKALEPCLRTTLLATVPNTASLLVIRYLERTMVKISPRATSM